MPSDKGARNEGYPWSEAQCSHSFISNVGGKYRPGDGICVGCGKEIIKAMSKTAGHTATPPDQPTVAEYEHEAARICFAGQQEGVRGAAEQLSTYTRAQREQLHSYYGTRDASNLRKVEALRDALRQIQRLSEKSFQCSGTGAKDIISRQIADVVVSALALAEEQL